MGEVLAWSRKTINRRRQDPEKGFGRLLPIKKERAFTMMTKVDREAVRAALEALTAENDEVLLPDAIVAAAKKKDSVLHPLFEWNDSKAAHAHRIDQARALVRTIKIDITTETTTVQTVAYIRNPDAEPEDQGYVSVMRLLREPDRARAALVAEFSRAAAALRRARELAIAFDMAGELDALTESIELVRTKVEARVESRQQ